LGRPGDILLIRSNGSVSLVGKSALVQGKERGLAYAGYLIRIRPTRALVEPAFLNLVLGSYDIRMQIEVEARSTSGVNNISGGEVLALRFLLPSLPEQKEIVRDWRSQVGIFCGALPSEPTANEKHLRLFYSRRLGVDYRLVQIRRPGSFGARRTNNVG
jgi:hypothetical protein